MPAIDTAGTYRAKLITKEFCKSSKGAEQLALGFEVTGEGPQKGHHLVEFLSFSDAALKYTEQKMRTLGWQGVDLNDLSTLGSVEVDIVVAEETWTNDAGEAKTRMRIKFINAIGASGMKIDPLGDGERKAFAAKMRAKLLGLNPNAAKANGSKPPPPAKSNNEPPPPGDDDIPPF